MKQPGIPGNEKERLEALYRCNILDTPAEKCFDQLTELAANVCNTPVAMITFVDEKRDWFKSKTGISATQAARNISFCAHTILGKDLFIVPDTHLDRKFADNPLVLKEPEIRFYAGAPLITPDGYALGAVCVIDHVPRHLTREQQIALKEIAKQIILQLEIREKTGLLESRIGSREKVNKKDLRQIKKTYKQLSSEIVKKLSSELELRIDQNRLVQALESAKTGTWDWDLQTGKIVWNRMHEKIFGFKPGKFKGTYQEFEKRIHPDDYEKVTNTVKSAIRNKHTLISEFRIVWPDKSIHWIRGHGQFIFDKQGKPVRMYGVVTDITSGKDAQIKLDCSVRALRVLSSCNAEITNAHDELKLLRRVCRLLIKEGGYRFAWIGYPQNDKLKTVKPMAHAGYEAGYLGNLITWNKNDTRGRGPTGSAIRCGKNIIARNIAEDTRFLPWRKPALERGYASSVSLALRANKEETLGALMIYASEVDAFDRGEVKLLSELADNLAWGIHSLRLQKSLDSIRKVTAQQLRELETLYQTAPIGYALMDKSCRYLKVNKTLAKMNGLPVEDHIGRSVNEIIPGIAPLIRPMIRRVFKTSVPVSGLEIQGWSPVSQKKMYWLSYYHPLILPDGKIHAVNTIIQDITEFKNLEETQNYRSAQTEFIGELGKAALSSKNTEKLLNWTVTELARILSVDYVKILELQPLAKNLLLKAGYGWQKGSVGVATVSDSIGSQAGYTLTSRKPVIVKNLKTEKRFKGPKILHDHNVTSGISVAIGDVNRAYGILGVHTCSMREFKEEDINFIESVANIIADTIHRNQSEKILLLEKIIHGYLHSDLPLEKILSGIIRDIEHEFPDIRCGVFSLEPDNCLLQHDICPGFNRSFIKSIKNLLIDLHSGLQGTAVYARENIIMEDILKEPLWKKYGKTASGNIIRACWSLPIAFFNGANTATLAIFYNTPKSPSIPELEMIDRLKRSFEATIEQIKTKQESREASKYNALLLNAAGEGICGIDRNGYLTFMNPAAIRILGWAEAEIIGKKMHKIIHHSYPDGSRYFMKDCPIRASIEKEELHQSNNDVFWKKDGRPVSVEYISTPVCNDQGEINGAVVIFRDITRRKQIEAEKNRLLKRNSTLVTVLGEIVYEWNPKINRIIWEGNYNAILGYTEKEIGKTTESWTNRIHPDDRKKVLEEVKNAAKESRLCDYQYRFLHRNGTYLWMHDRGILTLDYHGNVESIVGILRDISRQKQAERRILESEEKYRLLYDDNPNMCFTANEKGTILSVNKTGAKHLGYTPDELIGKPLTIVFPESEHAMVDRNLQYCIKLDGGLHEWEIIKKCKNGKRIWVKESARVLNVLGDIAVLIVCHDITKSKQDEINIMESQERLRNLTEKLHVIREDERSTISREIHDELGQVMTGLRIDLAWMLEQLDSKQLRLVDRTRKSLLLVDETLDSVRRISHDLRPAMLDDLGLESAIEWQVEEFHARTGCKYDLVLEAADIGLDRKRDTIVFRILQETLTNITRHSKASHISVSLQKQKHNLVLNIADNGIGISDTSLKSNKSIGLIGMRERVASIGGTLDISRLDDGGTRLVMSIPADLHDIQ